MCYSHFDSCLFGKLPQFVRHASPTQKGNKYSESFFPALRSLNVRHFFAIFSPFFRHFFAIYSPFIRPVFALLFSLQEMMEWRKIANGLTKMANLITEMANVRTSLKWRLRSDKWTRSLYRSPSIKCHSPEFENFLTNFKALSEKIKDEKPYASFYTGDFNGH